MYLIYYHKGKILPAELIDKNSLMRKFSLSEQGKFFVNALGHNC
jgi:hypothetical protein